MFLSALVLTGAIAAGLRAAPRPSSPWDAVLNRDQARPRCHLPRHTLDDDSLHRFDVLKYEPHLQFDLDQQTLWGQIEITLRADQIPLSSVNLRFVTSLTVDSVWADEDHFAAFTRNGLDSLQVLLVPPLALGDTVHVGVAYHGSPAIVDGWGGFRWGQSADWRPQIAFTNGDGLDLYPPPANYTWFPCHSALGDKVLWEGWFRAPANRVVSSCGVRVDTMHHADGTITWHYRLDQPVSTYLLFVAVSDYVIMVQRESGPRIENFVYPSRQTQAQSHFSNVPAVLDGFAALFGPYPFDRFGYAMTRIGDMEHATCVSHADDCVQAGNTWDWLLFHEMSHHWWGDWVTCGEWKDIWLNEGFATYCEALGKEIIYGFGSYMGYVTLNIFPRARSANDSYSIYDPDELWGETVYEKGAAVMHMLRMLLGDSSFFQAWREFGQEHAFGNVVTAQWQAKLEEHYGDSLDWFFRPWVYGTGYPQYFVTYGSMPWYPLIIEQRQPWATLFRMPVDLRAYYPNGDFLTVRVWVEALRSQSWNIGSLFDPFLPLDSIVLDPHGKILKTVGYDGGLIPVGPQRSDLPREFRLLRIYPDPFNALATIDFELPKSSSVCLRVFNLLGEELFRRDAGTLTAGKHSLYWDGSRNASGLYLFRLDTPYASAIAKAILLK
jgi:aminopeptidase N